MLQQVYAEFRSKNHKLGKSAYVSNPKSFKLSKYATPALKPAPYSCDQFSKLTNLGMMLNDTLGDCVAAAAGHSVQLMTSAAGTQLILPDSVIEREYSLISGYVPGDPSTDNGAEIQTLLEAWRTSGFGGQPLSAYLNLDPAVGLDITNSIFYFGFAVIGLNLPVSAQSETTWTVPSGGTAGDGAPGSWGGHCVPVVGYDKEFLYFITWGALYRMTWAFFYTYCDEAWALLSKDWINAKGVSLEGFNYAALTADLATSTI